MNTEHDKTEEGAAGADSSQAGCSAVIETIDRIRMELHDLARRLDDAGVGWAASEIRLQYTPRLWATVQKNLKPNPKVTHAAKRSWSEPSC